MKELKTIITSEQGYELQAFVNGEKDDDIVIYNFNQETNRGLANFYGQLVIFQGKLIPLPDQRETLQDVAHEEAAV